MLRAVGITAAVMVIGRAIPAYAQPSGDRGWEVEIHGGFATSSTSTSGTSRLPPPGSPQVMTVFVAGQFQRVETRLVPSWFFGDGPVLFNQVFNPPADFRIAPLDPLLARSIAAPRSGGSVGFRVARRLTPRFSAEFSFDHNVPAIGLSSDAPAQIESSRASYAKTWGAIASFFGPPASANATATLTQRGGHESLMTGALVIDIGGGDRILPYVVVGGGAVTVSGDLPSAQLTGDYRLQITIPPGSALPPSVSPQFHETDVVTIRGSQSNAPAAVFGGGARLVMSERTGIRIDLRDHLSRNTARTIVDAAPTAASAPPGTLSSFLLVGSSTVLQISNSPGTPSTLSDRSVTNFETFHARGLSNHLNLSAGLYFRF